MQLKDKAIKSAVIYKTVKADESLKRLFKNINIYQKPYLVESNGKAIGALVSPRVFKAWEERQKMFAVIDQIRAKNRGANEKKVEQDVNQAVHSIREKHLK